MNRRRFLADLLFAGGALSAAALLAQSARQQGHTPAASPTPQVANTPSAHPTPEERPLPGEPEPHVKGEVAVPREPVLGGKPAMPHPEPKTRGRVVLPQEKRP